MDGHLRPALLGRLEEVDVNISLTVQDRHNCKWNTNGKSYVAYRMAPLTIPLNDLEGIFAA